MESLIDAAKVAQFPGALIFLIGAAAALYKWYDNTASRKHKESKDHLETMISVVSTHGLSKNEFVVEQMMYFIYKVPLRYELIQLLLRLEFPSNAIRDFIDGRACVEPTENLSGFTYKRPYHSERRRKFRRRSALVGYCFFAVFGLISFLIGLALCANHANNQILGMGISYLIFTFASGMLAWLSLEVSVSVTSAERLIASKFRE